MRILQLCHKPPVPPKDGGCIAMHNVTSELLRQGHEVKLLTIYTHKHDLELDKLSDDYTSATGIRGVYVDTKVNLVDAFSSMITQDSYNVSRFFSTDFDILLAQTLQEEQFDIVHLESLFMTPYIGTIRRFCDAKIVLRSHNLEYIIWERVAHGEKNPAKRAYLKYLSRKLKSYELGVMNDVDGIAAISESDLQKYRLLGCELPMLNLPFGISLADYDVKVAPKSERSRLFHIGAMDWRPNVEGLLWFLEAVWPRIIAEVPGVELHLAGRGFEADMLPEGLESVIVHGEVENAQTFMESYDVMIVPLLSAGGIRVKIIEGLAKGKAILSTRVGVEGIDHEDEKHLFVTDHPDRWVEVIKRLAADQSILEHVSVEARSHAESHFDNQRIIAQLVAFYQQLMAQ